MTTIVYRDGIMAADTRAWAGGSHTVGSKIKVRRLPDGSLAGVSTGQPGASEAILDALEAAGGVPGLRQSAPPDYVSDTYDILVVDREGRAYIADNQWTFAGPIEAPFFAIGSGRAFAWAAMELGARPEVALSIACKGDPLTAPPFTLIGHDPARPG